MITYFYRSVKNKTFKEMGKFKKGVWTYATNPNEAEQAALIEEFSLDPGLVEDALDQDEVPRLEVDSKAIYIYTRFPFTNQNLQVETTPVMFVMGKSGLITVSKQPLPRLEQVLNMPSAHTTQPVKLLLQILDQIVHEYERNLNQISKQILSTRNRLRVEKIRNSDFIQFVTIEDELNEFMGALSPTNTILKRISQGKHLKLFEEDQNLVDDLMLSNEQSIESCKSSMKTIVSIREAYSTIATNNLNQIIRFLTSMTVVLTVPTIISSIYGMNIKLPLMNDPGAFQVLMGLTLLITATLLIVLKKKDWL
jgi:magnesium transporter